MDDEGPGASRLPDLVVDRSHLSVDHERAGAHPLPLRTFPFVATRSIVPNAVSGGEFRATNPQIISAFPTFSDRSKLLPHFVIGCFHPVRQILNVGGVVGVARDSIRRPPIDEIQWPPVSPPNSRKFGEKPVASCRDAR